MFAERSVDRLQAMQKVQQAAGSKGRGPNGIPTPAQIQAMRRAMPPGMMQQMQRQMRNGGGMEEMMKAMMQGQGGDQGDVEEMQRAWLDLASESGRITDILCRHDGADGRWNGWTRRTRWTRWARRHDEDDGNGPIELATMYVISVTSSWQLIPVFSAHRSPSISVSPNAMPEPASAPSLSSTPPTCPAKTAPRPSPMSARTTRPTFASSTAENSMFSTPSISSPSTRTKSRYLQFFPGLAPPHPVSFSALRPLPPSASVCLPWPQLHRPRQRGPPIRPTTKKYALAASNKHVDQLNLSVLDLGTGGGSWSVNGFAPSSPTPCSFANPQGDSHG